MKKILINILLLFMMTACSSSNVKLDDAEKLFTIDAKAYTEEDILNQILSVDYGQFLIEQLEDDVIEEILDDSDFDVEAQVEEEIKNFNDYAENLGMDISQLINYYGFSDIQEFEDQLRRSSVMDLYAKDKIQEDLDNLQSKYGILPLKAYTVESEETAKQMLRYVESDYEMEDFEKEFGLSKAEDVFYHDGLEGISEELKTSLETIEESRITYEGVSETQFIVYLYNDKEIDEDKLSQFILQETEFSKDLMVGKIKEGNLKIYNKQLKENMKEDFSDYIQ